jgi:hypothetical protein
MAEEKKPKIDLKSRLQKMGGAGVGAAPVPPAMGSVPASQPPPMAARSGPPVPMPPPSVPPPGIPRPVSSAPSRPPIVDPSNPLAAVAQPFKAATPSVAPAIQTQRIEVDEGAVQQARSSARKQGLVAGLILAAVVAVIAWMGGGASQQGADRAKSIKDAHELAADLLKAKDSLDQIKAKVQDGGKSLIAERKFPSDLAQQLSAIHVDFGGDKLFGRRFSGVPAETSMGLFDFITRVQALNDKKDLIVALLNKLEKPISDELSRPAGQEPISLVVIVDRDTPGGGTRLAPLVNPIMPGDKNGVPDKLLFSNPLGSGNVQLPRLTSDKIPKDGAAIPVVPTSFDKVCPSLAKGQIAQLLSSMNSLIDDIQGQKGGDSDIVTDAKPGLSDMAAKLADSLNKVH